MIDHRYPLPETCRQRGGALLVILFLAGILALSLVVSQLGSISQKAIQIGLSAQAEGEAGHALLGYVRTNGAPGYWGLLPLPDMGKRDATAHTEGEAPANFTADLVRGLLANSDNALLVGRLPFKTLGLSSLRDHSGNCLWYAVSAPFKATNGGAPNYVPTFNWDTLGDFDTGLSDDPHQRRAVALVFGPGSPIEAQSRAPNGLDSINLCQGNYGVANYLESLAPVSASGDNNLAVHLLPPPQPSPPSPPAAAGNLNLRPGGEAGGAQGAVITASQIFAQIASTQQIQNTLNNTVLPLLKNCLEAKPLPTNGLDLITVSAGESRYTNPLPANGVANNEIDCLTTFGGTAAKELARWRDNLWYMVCAQPFSGCVELVDTAGINPTETCDGLIAFSGKRKSDQKRSSDTQKRNPAQYFEKEGAINNEVGALPAFQAGALTRVRARSRLSANPEELSQDVAVCLKRPIPPNNPAVPVRTLVDITPEASGETLVSRDTTTNTITLGNLDLPSGALGGASAVGATFSGPLFGRIISSTANTVVLSAEARTENDVYNTVAIELLEGDGAGQSRQIVDYDGATRTATLDTAWSTIPEAGDDFKIDVGMPRFGNGVRVYFRFHISDNGTPHVPGPGFTFTLFDADRNLDADGHPTALVIGGAGTSGQFLGYAGRSNLLDDEDQLIPPIEFPKIGLEFDSMKNSAGATNVNDSTSAHVALVYWGRSHDFPDPQPATVYDDDNTHAIPPQPLPADYGYPDPFADSAYGEPALRDTAEVNRDFLVRYEIERLYTASPGPGIPGSSHYVIKLWIVKYVDGMIAGMDNVERDFPTISSIAPDHTQTIDITDLGVGTEAFRRFRFGFTNAQSTRTQQIIIRDLKLRLR